MTMENYRNLPSGTVTRARQLRRDRTEAEDRLWYALRDQLPAYKWRFQTPFHPYYADFVCMKARLVIEVDGGQHDARKAADDRRTRHFEALGYRVLRFWNHDVLGNADGVIASVADALALTLPLGCAKRAPPSPVGRGRSGAAAKGEGDRK